jgi:hypothetical protein
MRVILLSIKMKRVVSLVIALAVVLVAGKYSCRLSGDLEFPTTDVYDCVLIKGLYIAQVDLSHLETVINIAASLRRDVATAGDCPVCQCEGITQG